ncbi:transporter substrate-binding domain-containing protein [Duganella sp. FT135W]|uniref:Transporter substrate-binding domain-containing protein n=1 Tax=Duganella flavida TaxID=2692175 RepID=A0A6L8K755_9BURK|nr:transporter substrate-binding domain-containing protein [Duganella flavida]MYM23206.1 transporter substrate-binding domain-containing protein [Duganella flavida]
MKKWLFLLLLLSIFGSPRAEGEQKALVLLTYEYPPLMEQDSELSGHSGYAIEIVEEAFRRIKVPISVQFYPLARALAMLSAQKADGLFTLKKNKEREVKFLFSSQEILTQDYVIFVRNDFDFRFTGDIRELAGLSIGILNKAYYGPELEQALENRMFKRVEIANSHEKNFIKLLGNRMDAVICSRVVGMAILKKLNASHLARITGPAVHKAPSYVMFNQQTVSHELVQKFDSALISMHQDGTFAKIERKYLHSR